MERHWAVQHDAVLYPLLKYDFIGRQERLVEDLLKLEALLFGKEVFDRAALTRSTRRRCRPAPPPSCASTTPTRSRPRWPTRYALDFDTFGYSRDFADAL